MKTNLDKFYKTDKALETEGIWFEVGDKIAFRMKRFGGFNAASVKAASAKFYKPFARQVQMGTLPAEKEKEIMVKTFVTSAIVDWKGIEIDKKPADFSVDNCVNLLISLPDLADTLVEYASEFDHFKVDLGNS